MFVFYPLSLWISAFFVKKKGFPSCKTSNHNVSIIVAIRNAEAIIKEKIKNCFSLNHLEHRMEIIFSLDGSTDRTEEILKKYKNNEKIKIIVSHIHQGKAYALNRAAREASNKILLFTDADAILEPQSLMVLLRHFNNPEIGGVCGRRIIYKDKVKMKSAQKDYIKFDSMIKKLESITGSITSNDGKLYCIRKTLFQPIAATATDDLYTCLTVIKQGYKFIFEPEAKAFIRVPSRNLTHEFFRRRRIVMRSLRGIYLSKNLLNPFKYGTFAFGLFINKVLRRLLPIFLILLFLSSATLAFINQWLLGVWILQLSGYFFALIYPLMNILPKNILTNKLIRLSTLACYFCIGNLGTLFGLVDFLFGKKTEKWEPLKT
jgi:cellulose synthase/poly-beta-1,6-N-acetylglucosamine synthase-like glycosyltransferase